MPKAKKEVLKLIEHIRELLADQISHVQKELIAMSEGKTSLEDGTASISDALVQIDDLFKETEDNYDTLEKELTETKEELKNKEDLIEDLEAECEATYQLTTQIGELSYKTDNPVDDEIMELFSKCISEIQPAIMIENLKTIIRFKEVM